MIRIVWHEGKDMTEQKQLVCDPVHASASFMTPITVSVQIGNSDNKLTQREWAHYCAAISEVMRESSRVIFFNGGSDWDAPWQNACWVASVDAEKMQELKQQLRQVRESFRQDSVAIVCGPTHFI